MPPRHKGTKDYILTAPVKFAPLVFYEELNGAGKWTQMDMYEMLKVN